MVSERKPVLPFTSTTASLPLGSLATMSDPFFRYLSGAASPLS